MKPIYLLVGVPASGKSWVANQLKDKFDYLPHDDYVGYPNPNKLYVKSVIGLSEFNDNHIPILIETPFSMSQIIEPLEAQGLKVTPVFILEDEEELKTRYEAREGKPYNKGNITRQQTYAQRAKEGKHFSGTSEQVLAHLKKV